MCREALPRDRFGARTWSHAPAAERVCKECRENEGQSRTRGLRVGTLNVQGIYRRVGGSLARVDDVRLAMDVADIDVMVLTETKLTTAQEKSLGGTCGTRGCRIGRRGRRRCGGTEKTRTAE